MNRRTFIETLSLLPFLSTTDVSEILSKMEKKKYRYWEIIITHEILPGDTFLPHIPERACVCKASVDGKTWNSLKNFDITLSLDSNVIKFQNPINLEQGDSMKLTYTISMDAVEKLQFVRLSNLF